MTTSTDVRPVLVETSTLTVHPDSPLTIDRVLRRLEVARQRLSIRWCGSAGAFAGFEQLEVDRAVTVMSGAATFEATSVTADDSTHTVELLAVIEPSEEPDAAPQRVLVRGRGRTLNLALG